MKLQKPLFLFFLFIFSYSFAQEWKTYPHTPTGSLISFSKDEGKHASEEIEWWYTTGHLTGQTSGAKYSYMLSYFVYSYQGFDGFRILNITNDDTGEKYFNTSPVKYDIISNDKLHLQASSIFLPKTENWNNKVDTNLKIIPFEYTLNASTSKVELKLEYETIKRPLILGGNGKFNQGSSSYTYYYSQTKNDVTGTINFNGFTEDVVGISWIDRQYGSFNPLQDEKYEWMSLQLSNGMDINLWNLFTDDNKIPDNLNFRILSAYVDENTQYTTKDFKLQRLEFHYTSDLENCYSKKWHLTSSTNNIDLIIFVLQNDSEVQLPFRFYEGAITIEGTVNGMNVTGQGFAELLHTYEKPDLSFTHPVHGSFNSSDNITWDVNNLDEGNPLLFDVAYSIDNKQSFKTIAEGIKNPYYLWENPDIETGENIWFKITAYSIDKILTNSIISSSSDFILPVELFSKNGINVFPNPSSKELIIDLNTNNSSLIYQIFDLNGKILLNKEEKNTSTLKINISNFKSGVYILKLNNNNKTMQTKFLVN